MITNKEKIGGKKGKKEKDPGFSKDPNFRSFGVIDLSV